MIRYDATILCDYTTTDGYQCMNALNVDAWFTKPPGKQWVRSAATRTRTDGAGWNYERREESEGWWLGWSRKRLDLCPEHSTEEARAAMQTEQPQPIPFHHRKLRR